MTKNSVFLFKPFIVNYLIKLTLQDVESYAKNRQVCKPQGRKDDGVLQNQISQNMKNLQWLEKQLFNI